MRKLLFCVLASAALLNAKAQDSEPVIFEQDGMEFTVTGENTAGLSDAGKIATVNIPETVSYESKTYTVTSIEEGAFKYNSTATKVVMPNTITEVKKQGMYDASAVTEIKVSENLRTLGDYAFYGCEALTSIDLPEGITKIPVNCFFMSVALKSITLPSTVEIIESGAFYKSGVVEFTFPEACDSVGSNIFQLCPDLAKVTLNANLRVMSEGVFRECPKLTTADLTAATKLEALPPYLFNECKALSGTFTIPANVKSIGSGAFGGTAISKFSVAEANANFTAIDGVLYSADKTLLYAFPPKSTTTEVTVAEGCRGISGGAFDGAASITKVTLPKTMRAFDDDAFINCTALTDMNFPSSLVYMGAYALAGTGFTEITLPENMTAIYEGLLAQCPNLTKVTIPSSVAMIDMYAFRASKALKEVYSLRSVPAELNYYEAFDYPFYSISEEAVLHVPSGTIDAYESAGWGDGFAEIVDDLPAIFEPTSITPANDAKIETLEKVLITFPEAASIATQNPEIQLRKGDELSGDLINPDSHWLATDEKNNTVGIVGLDYDGFNQTFSLEPGEDYYLIIPAGTFKNANGNENQRIVLHYTGKDKGTGICDIITDNCLVLTKDNEIDVRLGSLQNCDIRLYDATGQLLQVVENTSGNVLLNNDSNGVLLINIHANGTSHTFKVVK